MQKIKKKLLFYTFFEKLLHNSIIFLFYTTYRAAVKKIVGYKTN